MTYINSDVVSWELPGVEVEPVIRHLDLVSIDNFLLENAISISETVPPSGVVEGGQTVEETGSESTKTAVTQRSVILLCDDIFDSEAELSKTS
jgi:hypothetical protein